MSLLRHGHVDLCTQSDICRQCSQIVSGLKAAVTMMFLMYMGICVYTYELVAPVHIHVIVIIVPKTTVL